MAPDRAALLDLLWRGVEPQVFVTREEWERGLDGWEITPVFNGDTLAFITTTRGPAFHFVSMHTGARVSLRLMKDLFQPLIDRHGYVETRTPTDDDRQRRFNERIGFHATGEDEFFVHYRMDVPIWKRGAECR